MWTQVQETLEPVLLPHQAPSLNNIYIKWSREQPDCSEAFGINTKKTKKLTWLGLLSNGTSLEGANGLCRNPSWQGALYLIQLGYSKDLNLFFRNLYPVIDLTDV